MKTRPYGLRYCWCTVVGDGFHPVPKTDVGELRAKATRGQMDSGRVRRPAPTDYGTGDRETKGTTGGMHDNDGAVRERRNGPGRRTDG